MQRVFPAGLKPFQVLAAVLVIFLSAAFGAGAAITMMPRLAQKPQVPPAPLVQPAPPAGQPVQFNTDSPVVTIARQVGPAVVGVAAMTGRNFTGEGAIKQGSGVIIDGNNGYIVTNNHVIAGADRISVSMDGNRVFPATLVGADERSDLAVLRIQENNLPQARLGDSAAIQVGETAVAIGNPLGQEFARSVTVGVISALDREVTVTGPRGIDITLRTLQTDAPINPGNSGGALVNLRGEVIGINSVKITTGGVEGMGFAIPINDARPIIDEIITRGRVTHPFLGIYNLQDITAEMARWYNIPEGVYIGGIFKDGPAARAGLQVGDVIIAVDNNKAANYAAIQHLINQKAPGDKVTLTVVRQASKKQQQVILTLGEMPSP